MDFGHDLRLYAHRGANRIYPENTIAAFRRALEDGATHLEMDVHRTRDGYIVVHHDDTGERLAGQSARINESTLAEVRDWDLGAYFTDPSCAGGKRYQAPLLSEVLEAFPGVPMNIDIKEHTPAVVLDVLQSITECGAADRVLLNSFRSELLRFVRHSGFRGATGASTADLIKLKLLPLQVLNRNAFEGDALQVPLHGGHGREVQRRIGHYLRFDTEGLIENAHAVGLRVDYWVINEPEEAARLLAMGADGLFTDDPAALLPAFRDHARSSGRAFMPIHA